MSRESVTHSKPAVTVLMPVHNDRRVFLEKSIASILDQTFTDFELLIVDDCSASADCLETIEHFARADTRIRVIRNEKNLGLTKTLNKGISMARGEYIARIDGDDIAAKERLEKQFRFMEDHPDYALAGSWAYLIDEYGHILGKKEFYTEYADIKKHILAFNFFTHSTWFFRKSIIGRLGGYSEAAPMNEDYDLLLRLASSYPVHNLNEHLCWYRIHQESISISNNKLQERHSIATRIRAIKKYGYPKSGYWYVIRAFLVYLLIPYSLKRRLLQLWKS